MNLIVIGTVAYDSIETPFGKVERTLGGSATYFALAAKYFSKPGVVGIVGEDFKPSDKALIENEQIDLQGLQTDPGKTFFWSGKYDFDLNNRTTLVTELNVLQQFNPILPESYKTVEYIFLGNMDPKLQKQVLTQSTGKKFVGLDTMNYWIERNTEELREVLGMVDVLIINDSEARELAKEANVHKAAGKILGMMLRDTTTSPSLREGTPPILGGDGPNSPPNLGGVASQTGRGGITPTLVIKRGEYGVMMFQEDKFFSLPAYPLEEVFDPTGAGDSFAGGFMGHVSFTGDTSWNNLKKACVAGSALASFSVEKMGTEGLLGIADEKIRERLEGFRKITGFEG